MRILRFIIESLRAKVMLLILFWAAFLLALQLIVTLLGGERAGDAELMAEVGLLRSIPSAMTVNALGVINKDPSFDHASALKTTIALYEKRLSELEVGTDVLDKTLLRPVVITKNVFKDVLIRFKLQQEPIVVSLKGLRAEWELQKPVFEGVADGEERTMIEVYEAVAALDDRSDNLQTTTEDLINAKLKLTAQVHLFAFVGVIAMAVFFFILLNRMTVQPLVELRDVARRFTEGDRSVRADIRSSDEIGKLALTFNDLAGTVSDREREEEARQRELAAVNEQLKQASMMKSQFLATMSHELRTPMNSIIGYSEVLLDGLDGDLNAEQREDVKAVLRSAEHLLKLINDILDLSKIEAGRMKVDIVEVRLRDIVKEATHTVEPLVDEKKLRLEIVFLDDEVTVRADRDRLKQILLNLLSNAVKFTETGGVKVRVMKEDDYGVVAVEDTGIGIPEDQVDAIFNEFYQVDGATTRKYGGTGLGLAIVRRLVELMGGTIRATSRLGVGSTFRVRLPLAFSRMLEVGETTPTILIVDDDAETVSLYGRYLAKESLKIISAVSVAEARTLLEKLPAGALSAALLDIKLPDGTGYDLLDVIRRSARWAALPVAVVSITDETRRSAAMGADAHIVKPVNRADLLKLVEQLCRQEKHTGGSELVGS